MKIGILTSGGDCPGLNAVIRGAVIKGDKLFEDEFIGYKDGWRGVIDSDYMTLPRRRVRGIGRIGGTILGTSRSNPFADGEDGAEIVRRHMDDNDEIGRASCRERGGVRRCAADAFTHTSDRY